MHASFAQWHYNNPLVVRRDAVSIEANIEEVYVFRKYLKCVRLSDYDYEESSSPTYTLGELSITSTSYSTCDVTSDVAKFQSIENPTVFKFSYPYHCHIKPKAQFSSLKNVEFNLFAGSWFPFHQLFDGLHTYDEISGASDVPLIAISSIGTEDQFVGEPSSNRQKVNLLIEARSASISSTIGINLKDGSEKISDLQWKTFVFVEDAENFCECLKWRYSNTKSIWAALDVDSQ